MAKRTLIRVLLLALCMPLGLACMASSAFAQIAVGISIHVAPPAIPVYVQPPCPTEGHLWTPGYWAYGASDYYWVPGVWVAPPSAGLLWTPGYWGFEGGVYGFHAGYWGPHIGFYGGVNYGFGYGGVGFVGGEWRGGHFAYNTAVLNVNTTVIHNTFVDKTVVVNASVGVRASFTGPGGTVAVATAEERAAAAEPHVQPTSEQMSHEHTASLDKSNFASANHGRPANPAMSRVGERAHNQQERIAKGVASGKMTPGQTAKVENQEAHINQQVKDDRAANGGKLTAAEKKQVNKEQNKTSKEIHNDKNKNKEKEKEKDKTK
ncbi:MAG TPA: YXWGXW repeat-containing protein [Candidatus Acidoferrum sp.]|nr:YXWGXW repeat-containing protein [Candidatus Acidoferrum sp.]